jgi:hypothetical protein
MRLPRLKVRTLMIVVALVALLIGATVESRRLYALSWHYYLKSLDAEANEYRASNNQLLPSYKTRSDHYARLIRKYRHAASHPWESVPPDPPDLTEGRFEVSRDFEDDENISVSEDGLEWVPLSQSFRRQWLDHVIGDLLPRCLGKWAGNPEW